MVQLIAIIILVGSLAAIAFILIRKMPLLVQLPPDGHHGLKKPEVLARLENKIRRHHFHWFEKQMLLHRLLSLLRVWTLKAERKVDTLLQGIRKKAQELDKKTKTKR